MYEYRDSWLHRIKGTFQVGVNLLANVLCHKFIPRKAQISLYKQIAATPLGQVIFIQVDNSLSMACLPFQAYQNCPQEHIKFTLLNSLL